MKPKRINEKKQLISPYLTIILSFILLIVVGAIFLVLPFSHHEPLSFVDALFLSSSAVTITGLTTISNIGTTLTLFGKIILTLLIQIGGLSVITISVFIMMFIGVKFSMSDRYLLKESLNQNSAAGVIKLIKKIVIMTFTIEGIGFLINLVIFIPLFPLPKALGYSIFHAISSFNNAGFDLFGAESLASFATHPFFLINTSLLIMGGGIGFLVLNDLLTIRKHKKLTTQTKIVLWMNLLLWLSGFLLIKLTNLTNSNVSWLEAFFLSVSSRTAGYTTLNLTFLSRVSLLIMLALMFIGASPVSTGGGIKTTTFYVLLKSVTSFAKGSETTVNNRLIPQKTKQKAFILFLVALSLVFINSALLLLLNNITLEAALFETISGFANVGLSLGITTTLTPFSKLLIAFLMFTGRIGPLTLVNIANKKWQQPGSANVTYLEEKLIIG